MPNWVTNNLTINGTMEQVNEVKEFLKDEHEGLGSIDFNNITPMPKWIYSGDLSDKEIDKYGEENCWLNWCETNWGTKWNARNIGSNSENIIGFNTAWASPVDLIKKLSWIYPKLEFEISWVDVMTGEAGTTLFQNGEILYRQFSRDFRR